MRITYQGRLYNSVADLCISLGRNPHNYQTWKKRHMDQIKRHGYVPHIFNEEVFELYLISGAK